MHSEKNCRRVDMQALETGDVITFDYLWGREAQRFQTHGLKDRPCVLINEEWIDGAMSVDAYPITHSKPDNTEMAIKLTNRDKKNLGLDNKDQWIILTEYNTFTQYEDVTPYGLVTHNGEWIRGQCDDVLLDRIISAMENIIPTQIDRN